MYTAVTPINYADWLALMLADLPAQFRDKPRWIALMTALSVGEWELEELSQVMTYWRNLADCVGAQLDGWGQIVGELRAGRSDADYRTGVYFRIYLNCSCGEPNRMMEALKTLTGCDYVYYVYDPDYRALYRLAYGGGTAPANLQEAMEAISPLGVTVNLVGV